MNSIPITTHSPIRLESPLAALMRSVFRAIDRPAEEAIRLSQKSFLHTLSPAIAGLALVAIACLGAEWPSWVDLMSRHASEIHLDGVRIVVGSLAVIAPAFVIMTGYLRLRLTPRAVIAAFAVGSLTAGMAAVSLLPMVVFLLLIAQAVESVTVTMGLLMPAVALGSIVAITARVLRNVDPSERALWSARVLQFVTLLVFLQRTFDVLFPGGLR
jgi:hypothetical protein